MGSSSIDEYFLFNDEILSCLVFCAAPAVRTALRNWCLVGVRTLGQRVRTRRAPLIEVWSQSCLTFGRARTCGAFAWASSCFVSAFAYVHGRLWHLGFTIPQW